MNPSNPFGSPQGGAFQVQSNAPKTGLFQSFGQQSGSTQPQPMGFFQRSAFGQPTPHGNTIFGQTPAFGQSSTQPSSASSLPQAPAFGQTSAGMSASGFGSGTAPAFGQASGSNPSSAFGQVPAFGQASGFSKQPLGFGQQPSGFGDAQMTSGSTLALGQSQTLGFGQSLFGQPSSTSVTTSAFGTAQSMTQSRGFESSTFRFKPANEALFKPIFSASPEPTNPQNTSMSSSPCRESQTSASTVASSSSTTTGFSLLTGAKSGQLGFSFSQPAATPSISAKSNPLTTANKTGPSNSLQFTFSQPAAPSSSSTQVSTSQPTTPSSFTFSIKPSQPQATPLFGQPSAFGDTKVKADTSAEEKGSNLEETNVFARLSKGTKRKEEPPVSSTGSVKPAAEEDVAADADSPRHPSKRPLVRSRGPAGGLFGRALSDLRKDGAAPLKRIVTKDTEQQALLWEETGEGQVQSDSTPASTTTAQTQIRDVLEKSEFDEVTGGKDLDLSPGTTTPVKRNVRRESSESLSGISPTDYTAIQCRNVPASLNKKDILEKHFGRFGKLHKVFCRSNKNLAIVHFHDHASAARAKKKGKMLQRHELLLLWQRKKQSPGSKGSRPAAGTEEARDESRKVSEAMSACSPVKRPSAKAPAVGSLMTSSHGSPVKKSLLAKSLQFDTEPHKESSTGAQSSECPVPSSLLPLIGQLAETAEDKYRLLEQRDKILRQGQAKRTDLDMSKVFVGTCPDMCPEKERFMRETRKQLSVFEVVPESEPEMVDHAAAIKEYSRSSADQEEPLPHDLRPLPVLCMTMDYLVTKIMDLGSDNYRDWYDFVWNRTRGIRKDITQQRLCCPNTVSLIEKCTRFHIHCAHHLCEEHMSSFDAKINNENMTKCLQSLKEMYQDLATRHTYCPREAEFRQYSVLLKLNDGDILREVQQFRDEVRNSPEVKFAVQAFTAVNSNNFVRFFKLVKGASYLASCLLHRYFNQVRAKALKTLNLAHTIGPRSTAFPLEDIVRILMFRDAAEATDFIQQYGLNVNEDLVELSRITYQEPDLPPSQAKSEVILAKKTVLIGEVVNGRSLPSPPQHRPVCSFDSQNKFRGEGALAEPTAAQFKGPAAKVEFKTPPGGEVPTQTLFHMPPAAPDKIGEPESGSALPADGQQLFQQMSQNRPLKSPSPPPKPQLVYSNEDVAAVLEGVIAEVVDSAVREVAHAGASYATTALVESSVQTESLLSEVLGQMLTEMSSAEIELERQLLAEEKRILEEARRRQEHEAFLVQFSSNLCTEIVHEVVDETIKETAASEIQLAVYEKADRVAKCTQQVCTSLVEDTLNAEISLLVESVLEAELQRIHKYINRWRDVVAVRRQLKRQMRGFPAAPCCVDPQFKLKALAPSAPAQPSMVDLARGLANLGNAGTLSLSSTRSLKMRREVVHQMRVHYYYQRLLDDKVWAPLDLPTLVSENASDPQHRIFWKAVLLLPSDHDNATSLADRILSDWLEVKFSSGNVSELSEEQLDGTLKTLCVTNTLQEKDECRVYVSIKSSRGPLTEDGLAKMEERCELHGTAALITLLPTMATVEPDEQDVHLLSALLQLKQLQQASTWHCPLPLVILVPGPEDVDTQKLEEALMLHTLVSEGLISQYKFVFIPETTSDLQGSNQLSLAMRWLLARVPSAFQLSCQTLVQLIEASLSREFTPRVFAHHQERAAACLPPEEPAPIIQLYNAVLAHVAEKVTSQELSKLSWPPCEFWQPETSDFVPHLGWNSVQHLSWLRKAILSLQLPQWTQLSGTDSWSELCLSISRYAAQIPVSHRSQPLLMSRLENLLEKVRLKDYRMKIPGSKLCATRWTHEDDDLYPASSPIPWDDVLVICIDHKLKDWQIPGPPVCEDAVTEDGEILVYFLTESLKGFQPPGEWTQAVRQTHKEKQQDRGGVSEAACATFSSFSLRKKLFHSEMEPLEAATAPQDITYTPTPQELLAHKVLQSLEEEKTESKRSMEQFQRWLDGDPVTNLTAPLFIPSSTLLSMPTTIRHVPTAKIPKAAPIQEPDLTDQSETAGWLKTKPVSMAWRLKELEQQILASQEEELACKLKLSGLLSIVDD